MLYAVDEKLFMRLKAFLITNAPENTSERELLLKDLALTEANPILSCLLWTKMDLVAEFRLLIQGTNPRHADGTLFQKTEAFGDPVRECLALTLANDVDEFCLGNRNDVATDIALGAVEVLREKLTETMKANGLITDALHVPLTDLIADYIACH